MENRFIEELLQDKRVKDASEDLMLYHLARAEVAKGDVLERIYSLTGHLTERLCSAMHERLEQEGAEGHRLNYKVTQQIAELKLYLDIISQIFNTDNIDAAYKKELYNRFESHRESILRLTDNRAVEQSLLSILIKGKND